MMQSLKLLPVGNWDGILVEGDALAGVVSDTGELGGKCNSEDYGTGQLVLGVLILLRER